MNPLISELQSKFRPCQRANEYVVESVAVPRPQQVIQPVTYRPVHVIQNPPPRMSVIQELQNKFRPCQQAGEYIVEDPRFPSSQSVVSTSSGTYYSEVPVTESGSYYSPSVYSQSFYIPSNPSSVYTEQTYNTNPSVYTEHTYNSNPSVYTEQTYNSNPSVYTEQTYYSKPSCCHQTGSCCSSSKPGTCPKPSSSNCSGGVCSKPSSNSTSTSDDFTEITIEDDQTLEELNNSLNDEFTEQTVSTESTASTTDFNKQCHNDCLNFKQNQIKKGCPDIVNCSVPVSDCSVYAGDSAHSFCQSSCSSTNSYPSSCQSSEDCTSKCERVRHLFEKDTGCTGVMKCGNGNQYPDDDSTFLDSIQEDVEEDAEEDECDPEKDRKRCLRKCNRLKRSCPAIDCSVYKKYK